MTWPFPVSVAGRTTTAVGGPSDVDAPVEFNRLGPGLQGMGTRVVYIAPNGNLFNLAGPNAGREGVRLAEHFQGDQQWPFKQVLTNSPYIMGADINRQDIPERKFDFGIVIGHHAPPMTEYQYRMAEGRWWAGQDEANDGWLGIYTRFTGWRWIPVRPGEMVASPEPSDPTTYGNNASRWTISWLASRPYFTKPALYKTWQASSAGPPKPPPGSLLSELIATLEGQVFYWGTLPLANRGDLPSFASFLISSPGTAIVQDNDSTRMVVLPQTMASVGTYLCDTEPTHRTLVSAGDPQDNLLFDLIRQSVILDFFLSGIAGEGLPLMLRFQNRFIFQVPAQSTVQLTIGHTNPSASITASLPQRYKRSR